MAKDESKRQFLKYGLYGLGALTGLSALEELTRSSTRQRGKIHHHALQTETQNHQDTLTSTSNDNSWSYGDLTRLEDVFKTMQDSFTMNPTLYSFCDQNKERYNSLQSRISNIHTELSKIKPSMQPREFTEVSETGERYTITGTPVPIDLASTNLDKRVRDVLKDYAELTNSRELKNYVEKEAPYNNPIRFTTEFVKLSAIGWYKD